MAAQNQENIQGTAEPVNRELLWLQSVARHRSSSLFNSTGEDEPLDCRRCDWKLWQHIRSLPGKRIDERVFRYIRDAGLGGVFEGGYHKLDHALITALVERWRPETHTFHFPVGEATVTLQDVQVLWGLPIDGEVFSSNWFQDTEEGWSILILEQLGIQVENGEIKGGKIKLSCLARHLEDPYENNEVSFQQRARLYILYLLGGTLFVDRTSKNISCNYVYRIIDLSRPCYYSWGTAVLACLYRNLCDTAEDSNQKCIAGPLSLLQYWAWERLPYISPICKYQQYDFTKPYANRWDGTKSFAKTPSHVVTPFRSALVAMREGQYIWCPYDAILDSLPEDCRRDRELWTYFKAVCFTRGDKYRGPPEQIPCMWAVTVSRKNKHGVWRVCTWVNAHNCYGNVRGNNNRCLTSSLIATEISGQVNKSIAYPVKHIQAQIKRSWNIDVSYDKAWNGRRIAIERIFGTWDNNFAELPKYIDELVHTNPETVVEWLHHPESSSEVVTFKYVFWAFGPAIQAFQLCIPVVFVDGTHLKGNYKGKLLTALTKNANGQILPVAFAMVDEKTNEIWSWFFQQFHDHVAVHQDRELCVISDRHQGIINAMNEMTGWHHCYCLRHIRSNFMSRFKDNELKRLCWVVGSTTQNSTYRWAIREIKGINPDAWVYLSDIDVKKWTFLRDEDHRRWGNLTTNVAESLNNVLRLARMMPIKACIEYTFDYTRLHFIKQYQEARDWTSPLARKMWQLYQLRERNAATHTVDVYGIEQSVYKVRSMHERNGDGDYDYTVKFGLRKCTCGKWQNQRFPCSHAIAVCGHMEVDAKYMASKKYTVKTWRAQYSQSFIPLRDMVYWREPTWNIQADSSRLVTHRGRRRARRIRNEMDDRSNRTKQPARCHICNGHGHNRNTCPNRQ